MPGLPSDPVQTMSKTLFGQLHRLEVMDAIARSSDGLINPTDLAAELGYASQSPLQAPVRDLEQAGLLIRLPTEAGRTYFQRAESAVWVWIEELMRSLLAPDRSSSPMAPADRAER